MHGVDGSGRGIAMAKKNRVRVCACSSGTRGTLIMARACCALCAESHMRRTVRVMHAGSATGSGRGYDRGTVG